jgi:hypothetical protein
MSKPVWLYESPLQIVSQLSVVVQGSSYKLMKYLVPVCTGRGALLEDDEGVRDEVEIALVVVLTGGLVALVALVAAVAGTHWSTMLLTSS